MATDRGPWCTLCGWKAVELAATIDPDHPIGRCIRGHNDTGGHNRTRASAKGARCPCGALDSAGCGRVIVTRSEAEAQAVYTARERKHATSRHIDHLQRKRPSPLCDRCAAGDQVAAQL